MRWYILFLFSLSNCNQCLAWFSFNSTDMTSMRKFFGDGIDRSTIDLFLNWGPIIGIAFFPFQTWLLQRKNGLQRGIWVGMVLLLLGNIIRCIPILGGFVESKGAFLLYHTGQIAIAAAGPFFMGTTTRLSVMWFAESERTTATAIATTANGLGTTIGFLNPLWLARTPEQIPHIFYLSLVLAIVPVLMGLYYLPPRPPTPANAASDSSDGTNLRQGIDGDSVSGNDPELGAVERQTWCQSVSAAASNKSFLLLVVSASFISGVASGWQGLLQSILGDGAGISASDVSWIGFGNALAGNIAALVAGRVMDRFRQRLKLGIIIGLFGCFLSQFWFLLQLPCVLWPASGSSSSPTPFPPNGTFFSLEANFNQSPLPRSEITLIAALTLSGFFQGMTSPLFYELAAELIYPIKEGMSAGILVLLLNSSAMVIILCNNSLQGGSMNLIMTSTVLLVMFIVAIFVKEQYRRPQDAERTQTKTTKYTKV